jgi:hypothetical protein
VELQAQLYRTQEHARLRAEGLVDVKDKHVRRKAGTLYLALCNVQFGNQAMDSQLSSCMGRGSTDESGSLQEAPLDTM